MIIPDGIKEKYARKLFHTEHPRTAWKAHPNYKELQRQDYYRQAAAVMINNMLDDPDIQKLFDERKMK